MPHWRWRFTKTFSSVLTRIFTYGPLGFLEFPQLYFTSTFVFAELYVIAIHLLFFAALYWSLSRSFGKGWAVVLAVAGTWGVSAALLATPQGVEPASPGLIFVGGPVLIWCCALVRDDLSERATKVMPLLLGAGTALLVLVETNMSVLVGALSVIALLLAKGQRLFRLFAFATSSVILFVVFWIIDGQSVTNIGRYLYGSEQISSGYTAAMSVENAPTWQYLAAFALAVLIGFIVYFASPRHTFYLTWAPMILVIVFLFLTFKETFVIHGPGHKYIAFAACLVALLAVPVSASIRLPVVGALIVTSVALVAVNGFDSTFNALRNGMESSIRVPATMLSPARRAAQMQTVREEIQDGFVPGLALGPKTVGLARGKTTYIQDGQAGVSWAYPSLIWKPLPVLQEYSTYTRLFGSVERRLHRLQQWSRADTASAVQRHRCRSPRVGIPRRGGLLDLPLCATRRIVVVAGSRTGLEPLRSDAPDLGRPQPDRSNHQCAAANSTG